MKVQTYDYNSVYLPAAPFVPVGVSGDNIDAEPIQVNAQTDTGADASMMPVAVLESAGALFESLNNLVVTLNGPANTTEIALDNSS
jgi:hypothetical protein